MLPDYLYNNNFFDKFRNFENTKKNFQKFFKNLNKFIWILQRSIKWFDKNANRLSISLYDNNFFLRISRFQIFKKIPKRFKKIQKILTDSEKAIN